MPTGIYKHKKPSDETKKKMSETRKKRKEKLGYVNSIETRKRMSKASKGKSKRFLRGENNGQWGNAREKSPTWKGGKTKHNKGYVYIYSPDHPYATNGYVFEHRLVMEAYIGRPLLPTEVVHHINGIKDDNRIGNLMLFNSDSDHKKYESKKKK